MGKWLNCQLFGAVLTPCVGHLCTSALPSALLVQPGQSSLLPYSDHTKVLWGVDSFAEKQLACLSYSAESPSSSCPQPQPVQAPGALPAGTDAAPGSLVSERWLPWARALWWGSDPLWAREQILPAILWERQRAAHHVLLDSFCLTRREQHVTPLWNGLNQYK